MIVDVSTTYKVQTASLPCFVGAAPVTQVGSDNYDWGYKSAPPPVDAFLLLFSP